MRMALEVLSGGPPVVREPWCDLPIEGNGSGARATAGAPRSLSLCEACVHRGHSQQQTHSRQHFYRRKRPAAAQEVPENDAALAGPDAAERLAAAAERIAAALERLEERRAGEDRQEMAGAWAEARSSSVSPRSASTSLVSGPAACHGQSPVVLGSRRGRPAAGGGSGQRRPRPMRRLAKQLFVASARRPIICQDPVLPVEQGGFVLGGLQPLLTAAETGGDAGHVVAALGFPPGHPKRGLAFAVLNGALAVARPTIRLAGLSAEPRTSASSHKRAKQFGDEAMPLCMIAVFSDVQLPTVVQSVARELRASPGMRARHGQRFLSDLAGVWRSMRQ